MVELVYTTGLKLVAREGLWVRPPLESRVKVKIPARGSLCTSQI